MAAIPCTVELFYSGVWNDHTSDVRAANRVQIRRKRPAELRLAFNNHDSKYSPRNPESPLYGLIARNTPIRVSVLMPALVLPGTSGNYASTPDNAALDITGDLDIRIGVTLTDWTPAAQAGILAKWNTADASYRLTVETSGLLRLAWSADGTTALSEDSDAAPTVPATGRLSIRATLDVDNGASNYTVRFYTSTDTDLSTATWTQLGGDDTGSGVTSIFSGTAPLVVGSTSSLGTSGMLSGVVHAVQVRSGIGGTIVASPDFTAQTPGTTSFADSAERTWTVNGTAEIAAVTPDVRFVGEVESWPVRSQGSGKDVWAPIVAYGLTRRLGNGGSEQLAQSALRRFMAGKSPDGYWPLEDGPNADGLRSVDGSDPDMTISRSGVTVAADAGLLATWLPNGVTLPNFTAIRGYVGGTSSTEWHIDLLYRINAPRGNTTILTIEAFDSPAGGGEGIFLRLWGENTSDGSVAEICYPDVNTSTGSTATGLGPMTGNTLHHVRLSATQSGGNIVATGYVDGVQVRQSTFAGTLFALDRVGVFTTNEDGVPDATSFNANQPVTVGHMTAYGASEPVLADVVDAANGHQGEQAHERIQRLCGEEGITVTITGTESATLGPQGVLPPVELMHEAAAADGGVFSERRDALALAYLTHAQLYNQTATTLDYSNREVWKLEPSEDTDHLANVVTVTRRDGGESTVERDTGSLGTTTVGRYPVRVVLSLETDGQTLQQAAQRSHIGTWDEPRFPVIGVNLAGLINSGQTTLANAIAAVDLGSRLDVSNPPDWAGPDSVSVHVEGYFEDIGSHTRTVEFSGSPARPYAVGVLDTARLAATTTISEDLTTTETDITVPTGVFSTTNEPYDVVVGGEVMTVTSATSTVLTVTRSVNGVVKTHSTGAPISIHNPLRLARGA